MNNFNIITECYADTLLVEMLGFQKPNHQLGIAGVGRILNDEKKSGKLIGIVDQDKRLPESFKKNFEKLAEYRSDCLELYKHTLKERYLIFIQPAFEGWIFHNARQVNYDMGRYGINNLNDLKNISKKIDANKNPHLRNLINALIQKQAPGMVQLRTWLENLS